VLVNIDVSVNDLERELLV